MPPAPSLDWTALGEEAVQVLADYLRIDTTNPPGNETAGARFLSDLLARDGIESRLIESAPGRGNLIARLAGDGSERPILLHHHIDVVYADRRYWSVDPFGGVTQGGFLYGRGALDMKSVGILQVIAVLALRRARVRLKRDVVLLATADEEAGSRYGALFLSEQHPQLIDGVEYSLGEFGGIHTQAGWNGCAGDVSISEKTGFPIRLTARGVPGHGSMPWPDTSVNRLIRALGRLLAAERPLRVIPEIQEYFSRFATLLPESERRGWDDLDASLSDPAFREKFLSDPHRAAMLRTTFAVTMLRASEKRNVIPPEAVAEIDCRLLAGDDPDEVLAWVRKVVADDQVTVEPVQPAKVPNLSPPDTALYKALGDAIRRREPRAVVLPLVLAGFTDNWVFRRHGVQAYGFAPFVTDEGELHRVHGNDERISLENVRAGVRTYTELLLAFAAA
ncbi:MAG: M20/M25/M40 family metallo-hydrolase [Candidatus Rokubacteria bacterium]|nr:M20/M25/M40 family metallo-hydrolase [Candidatus Rokubacteria bacterium]